ncbi:MAG TPA: hypothetical protein VNE60_03290 [Gemmatimonadaceae bacterium]|jgi:hypothetical protein|nr:hypothetical protein [Gemmatimonadaceae bacterium]
MGAVAMIVVLAGMAIPITLLLATLLFDLAVVGWALYRMWRDRWRQHLGHTVGRYVTGPITHAAGAGRSPSIRKA